jgi:hypothetical protein
VSVEEEVAHLFVGRPPADPADSGAQLVKDGLVGTIGSICDPSDDDRQWRRPEPVYEPEITHDEVVDIFVALADIKRNTLDILAILGDEEDDDEQ